MNIKLNFFEDYINFVDTTTKQFRKFILNIVLIAIITSFFDFSLIRIPK